ncbi:hypothetical protein GCM10009574_018440 [Streptomyces asiaticus]|uniref:Uncharacterized protein n=1 Tax=Streptomyces rhizosphaericus TaxID=114699 RepID=A0ABN1NTC0_9ACTN
MGDEDLGLLGEPHPAAHRLQQPDTDLRLQLGQLLGDGRRAAGEGGGDGREGAAVLELAQQTQSVQVERGVPALLAVKSSIAVKGALFVGSAGE